MKPPATLSLDLDDAWAYLRARGDRAWETAPSMLGAASERLLPLLRELDVRITVFVVGRDLERHEARAVATAFAEAGHEMASHSLEHRSDLAARSRAEIADDLRRAADLITGLTGQRPIGFRCPSFGVTPTLLSLLARDGYGYDASLLPTALGPLLRWRHRASMPSAARREQQHAVMFGSLANALLPLQPFRWQTADGPLLEMPVSTVPLLRTPFHMSYLHALGMHSAPLARAYFDVALRTCRARGVAPSFLLHLTDLLDVHDAPGLSYFTGMSRPWRDKVPHVRQTIARLTRDFRVVPLGVLARELDGTALAVRPSERCAGGN